MTITELNKFAGRKREFPKEAKSTMKFNLTKVGGNNLQNFNNIQNNIKFSKYLKNEIKKFNKENKQKNKNNKFQKEDFAKNIKFKSILSVTNLNLKKNKKKLNNKIKSKSKTKTKNKSKNSDKDFPDLPKNFKRWVDHMPEVRNQGKCGSCYAVSTLNMLESRLNINLGIKEDLSLNHILKCSVYNQGCEGGYSYLVMKFGKELELIPKRCEKGHFDNFQCSAKKCKPSVNKFSSFKITNFGYLGGSYGKCNEELLMRELIEKGPVVVSFEPDYHFMMYRKGIYKSINNNWMTENLPKPEWEKVDHSVTLVGWGYDEVHKQKYWLLMNSWGKHWGEDGYFRMVRGEDHMGIESICEFGEIVPQIV